MLHRTEQQEEWDCRTELILEEYGIREILGEPEFELGHTGFFGEDDPQDLLWYHGSGNLHIYVNEASYTLLIGNQEWDAQCLMDLEERLAEFAVEEGYFRPTVLKSEYRGNDEEC